MTNRFMTMTATLAAAALVLASGTAAPAAAVAATPVAARTEKALLTPHDPSWPDYFKLEWHTALRHGQPVVEGRILNDGPYGATGIRLLVEALDQRGHVVGQRIDWLLPPELTPGTSGYFVIPAPPSAAAYRVGVYSFESEPGSNAG